MLRAIQNLSRTIADLGHAVDHAMFPDTATHERCDICDEIAWDEAIEDDRKFRAHYTKTGPNDP